MLHIVLTIVKIAGFLLLGIAGLLLLAAVLILFVPVRYRARIRAEEGWYAKASVSWLLHLIHGELRYHSVTYRYRVKIAGIPFLDSDRPPGKKRNRKRKRRRAGQNQEVLLPEEPERQPAPACGAEAEAEEQISLEEPEEPGRTEPEQEAQSEDGIRKAEDPAESRSLWQKCRALFRKLAGLPGKLLNTVRKWGQAVKRAVQRAGAFQNKAACIQAFLKEEETKQSLRYVLGQIRGILKHVLPQKIKGVVRFGTGDPCSTGQLLGAVSLIYHKMPKKLRIYPDFQEQKIEGDVALRGRIIPAVLTVRILGTLLNKELKETLKRGKNLFHG